MRPEDGSEVGVAGHLELVPHRPQLLLPLFDDRLVLPVPPWSGNVSDNYNCDLLSNMYTIYRVICQVDFLLLLTSIISCILVNNDYIVTNMTELLL